MPASDYPLPDSGKGCCAFPGCSGVFRLFFPGAGGVCTLTENLHYFCVAIVSTTFRALPAGKGLHLSIWRMKAAAVPRSTRAR